jgi:DNA-binding XRE family transcriptional regulator
MGDRKNIKVQKVLHRIEELRKLRGQTQEELGDSIGRNKWFINRLEKGQQELDLTTAHDIAKKLRVDVGEVLAVTTSVSTEPGAGFVEDVRSYVQQAGQRPIMPSDPSHMLYEVVTEACANAGIPKGFIIEVDPDKKAIRDVAMGDVVVVSYRAPGKEKGTKDLLRQFMPPQLVITNAPRGQNARMIDLSLEEAQIIGVFVGSRKPRN